MSKVTRLFLERIVDRCVAIVAGIVGSTLSTICAQRRAEQQGELEDLAIQYEKAGKLDAADTIRQHARRMSDNDPAHDATAIMENVLNLEAQPHLTGDDAGQPLALSQSPSKPRRRRRTKPPVEEC